MVAQIRGRPGGNPPAGGRSRIRARIARALHRAGLPDLFHPAPQRGGRPEPAPQRQETQPRKVPDFQPAVCHSGSGRAADSEESGTAGRPPDRPETFALHSGRPPGSEKRRAAVRRLRAAGRVPADLRHQRAGRRAQRIAGGRARPVHHLSEAIAVGPAKVADFAALSGGAGGAGVLPDRVPGHLRGPQLRHAVQQHAGDASGAHAVPDRPGHHGSQLRPGGVWSIHFRRSSRSGSGPRLPADRSAWTGS